MWLLRMTTLGAMSDRVTVTMDGGVADVRLNRPDKMNALDQAMFDALVETSASLAAEAGLRSVVLSGEGKAFCAGLDFGSFQKMAGDDDAPSADSVSARREGQITHHGQQSVYGWTELPVPVIAAIDGVALGGGIQLALGADMRYIAPGGRMSVLEIRWGLVPDMTGTQRLIELVGLDVAMELTLTGRMVEGPEAVSLGLATRVEDDPRAAALETAHTIAAKSPHAVRAAKRLLRAAGSVDEAEGFRMERHEIAQLIGSHNQVEAVQAFFEQRDPVYSDPD